MFYTIMCLSKLTCTLWVLSDGRVINILYTTNKYVWVYSTKISWLLLKSLYKSHYRENYITESVVEYSQKNTVLYASLPLATWDLGCINLAHGSALQELGFFT